MGLNFSRFSADSFRSLLTGLGVSGRDKVLSMEPTLDALSYNQRALEALYRGNWLAKKIVDIPAFDSTRAWRQWDAERPKVEALEAAEKSFGIQKKVMDAMIKARLYGGSAMIMGIKGDLFNTEIDLDKIGKGDLKFIHTVEKWMIQAGPRVRDITSPWFGEPNYYMRSNIPIIPAPGGVDPIEGSSLGFNPGDTIFIHPSRVVRMVGVEYPDMEHSPDAWGDSVLTSIYEAIRDAGMVTQSMANMVADSKVDVFRIPGLTSTLSTTDGTDKLMAYLSNANVAKSVINSLLIDKDMEWERIQTKFEGMPQVLQAYLLICAAGADIPSTRLLAREPTGMNATGDSDIRNYYDKVSSEQRVKLGPLLNRLDEVLIRSTFGDRDPSITYEWEPLWQMSETEKADMALKKAQAFKIDVDSALIPAEALVKGRENQLIEDGFYPGLDTALDDLKKSWEEEVEYLPHQQMEHQQGMQQNQLTFQKEQFGSDPGDKTNDALIVANSHYRVVPTKDGGVRFIPVQDEGGQASLGFQIAGQPAGRRKRRRPFAVGQSSPHTNPDVNYGPNEWPNGPPHTVTDATPRTLYVRRDVLNADDIVAWAKSQGFSTTLPASEMHVTVAYSRQPVNWMKASEVYGDQLTVPASGVRMVDLFGPEHDCAVLLFNSGSLSRRHEELESIGATWDYQEYQPHIAVSYGDLPDINKVKPYGGLIVLGPEIFETVKDDWHSGIQSDSYDPDEERDEHGRWGSGGAEHIEFYHGTARALVKSIKQHGLVPSGDQKKEIGSKAKGSDAWAAKQGMIVHRFTVGDRAASVYMTTNPMTANTFAMASSQINNSEPIILKLKIPFEKINDIFEDEKAEPNMAAYRFKGKVTPDMIDKIAFSREGRIDLSAISDAMSGDVILYAVIFAKSDDDSNDELPRRNHENDPLTEDADWDEGKHPRGQPSNKGQFGPGGGGDTKIASRDDQFNSIVSVVEYLRQVGQINRMPDGMVSKQTFILQNGIPYMANAKTYAGPRGKIKLCYMNASHDALDHKDRTYVEGYITTHGIPIEHAWTTDSTGQIYDSTIRPDMHVSGYFGVPFTRDYLMNAMDANKVYGLLGHDSRKTLGPLLRGTAKNFKEPTDPKKLSDDVIADRLSIADKVLSTIPVTDKIHSPERLALRDSIVEALYSRDLDNRTSNRKATIVLGLPGSGKSNLSAPLVKEGRLEIEGDNAKAMLPEFAGGVGAYAVHEESSAIMRRVLAKAIAAGDDIVWPRIDSQDKIVKDVKSLHDAGYEVSVKLADVPSNVAIHSAITRFLKMGRYVSPDMISNYGNSPRESYDAAVATGLLASHERYQRGPGKGFVKVA